MNQFQRDFDAHITSEQPGDALDDVYTLAEQFIDAATVRLSTSDETFLECRICGDVDSHADSCPIPAIEKWVNSMTLDPLTSREQSEAEEAERLDDWAEAQHRALLESYVKRIWQHTSHYYVKGIGHPRTLLHRLEQVVRMAHKVDRQGVAEGREDDYQLDLLLTEWGAGKLIAYFGALAETEGEVSRVYVAGILGNQPMFAGSDLEAILGRVDRYNVSAGEESFSWQYTTFEGDLRLTATNPANAREYWYIATLEMEPSK